MLFATVIYGQYNPLWKIDREIQLFITQTARKYDVSMPRDFNRQPLGVKTLIEICNRLDSLDMYLTSGERERLLDIRNVLHGERRLYTYKNKKISTENYLNVNLIGDMYYSNVKQNNIGTVGIINPTLRGNLGSISYFSEVSVWTEFRNDTIFPVHNYEPFNGNPYNLFDRKDSSNVRTSDHFRGGMSVNFGRLHVDMAMDNIKIGPALFSPLTASGEGAPIAFVRGVFDIGRFNYTQIVGELKTQKNRQKYWYFHRFDVPLFNNHVEFGINEMIVNGDATDKAQSDPIAKQYQGIERSIEFVYLIPFIPYSFAEHYVGDLDNALLSVDLTISWPKKTRWYVEFLLDDISSPAQIFGEDWGNKWALTAGVQYFTTLNDNNLTMLLEYSRVEPWVYTHFMGGSTRYTHYAKPFGSIYGPDSDLLTVMALYDLGTMNTVAISFQNIRKGKQRGSHIRDVFHSPHEKYTEKLSSGFDKDTKVFLGDDYLHDAIIGMRWEFNPFGRYSMISTVEYSTLDKLRINLYGKVSL